MPQGRTSIVCWGLADSRLVESMMRKLLVKGERTDCWGYVMNVVLSIVCLDYANVSIFRSWRNARLVYRILKHWLRNRRNDGRHVLLLRWWAVRRVVMKIDQESPNFVVRPLPWRSDKVNSFFSSLDSKFIKNQSKKSVMMTIHRSKGLPSDRSRPSNVPNWALQPCVWVHILLKLTYNSVDWNHLQTFWNML